MGGSKSKPQRSRQSTRSRNQTKSYTDNRFNNTQTTSVTGPSWAMGAGKDAVNTLRGIGENFEEGYGFNDLSQGWQMARDVAQGLDPHNAIDRSLQFMGDTLDGKYLFGGEGFNAAVDAAFRAGMPKVLSAFGGGGRSDGGLAKEALAKAFSDPFAMQYGQERQFQNMMAQAFPGMALMPASIMEGVGNAQDARAMQEAGLWNNVVAAAQPFLGSTTTQSGTSNTKAKSKSKGFNLATGVVHPAEQGSNPMQQVLGGAMVGSRLLGGAGGGAAAGAATGPVGALAGGLLGGIGSFFG